MLSSGNSYSTYVSASGNEGSTQYRASAAYQRDEGAMQFHDGAEQTNVRLNLDQSIGDQLQFSLSSYVTLREQDVIFQQERAGPERPDGSGGRGAARSHGLRRRSQRAGSFSGPITTAPAPTSSHGTRDGELDDDR